ncbi:MAG: hypothetical protein ACYTBJ_24660 [Planctomycetota bacterium]
MPYTTAKHIWKFGVGTGTSIYDSTVAPIFEAAIPSAIGDLTGQGPEFQKEILRKQEEIDRNLASDLAGLEQGSFNFVSWLSNVGKTLPRRLGGRFGFDTWDDIPEDQLKQEFRTSMERYLQGLEIGKGKGEFSQAVGGEFIREAEETGGLDEDRIAAMAEADPAGFFMFGQAFRLLHAPVGAGKQALTQAEKLTRARQQAGKVREQLPPGDPARRLADDFVNALEQGGTKASRAMDSLSKVTTAADDLMKAQLQLRMANQALKRFGPTAERQASVDTARAKLQAVSEAVSGQFGARALASIRGAASRVSGVDLGVKAASLVPTAGAQVARAGAKAIETLPTTAGVAGGLGLLLSGRPISGLALMFGARKIPGAQAAATTAAKPLRIVQRGLEKTGKALRAPVAETQYQKALRGITRGNVEIVAEGLKGVPIDIGFALALAQSPEDVQNMSGYASAFKALHAAGRPLARFVQAIKTDPLAPQAPAFLPRQAGNVRNAAALSETWRRSLPPDQQKWVAAQEQFLREIGSEAPVYGMTPEQFKTFLADQHVRKTGSPPTAEQLAEFETRAKARGAFMEEVIGDKGETGSALIITDPQAVHHEGMHEFQRTLGRQGNENVDMMVMEEYGGVGSAEWESFASRYASALLGKEVGPTEWRGEIAKQMPKSYEEVYGDKTVAADHYIAREFAAENFAELFKATGGKPSAPPTLVERLAGAIDVAAKFFGQDLLANARSEGLGVRTSSRLMSAIRSLRQNPLDVLQCASRCLDLLRHAHKAPICGSLRLIKEPSTTSRPRHPSG